MRTTVDIPDALHRDIKERAAREGITIRKIVLRGLCTVLQEDEEPVNRIRLPIVKAKLPDGPKITNKQVYAALFDFP